MEELPLIVSITLNVILVLCLFFKSALNDIVKTYWQNKLERNKDRNQRIIDLRKHLFEIRRLASTALIYAAEWLNAEEQSTKETGKSQFKATLEMSRDSIRSVRDDMIYYPDDIKSAVEAFFFEHQKFMDEIATKPMHKNRLLEITDYVDSSLDNIIEMIDKKRSKLIC